MTKRMFVTILALGSGCFDETSDLGSFEPDDLAYEIVDEGQAPPVGDGVCTRLSVALVGSESDLQDAYEANLGVPPPTGVDLIENIGLLGWVEGCYGDPAIELASLTAKPDELFAHYVVSGITATGDARSTPYVLVTIPRLDGYRNVEASVEIPAR